MKHLTLHDRITRVTQLNVSWEPGRREPFFQLRPTDSKFSVDVLLDPMPGYCHSPELVETVAKHVEAILPVPIKPLYFTSELDGISRLDYAYSLMPARSGGRASAIFFFGRRTPIHPAMTRYVVARAYAHVFITSAAAVTHPDRQINDATEKLMRSYALIREVPYVDNAKWNWDVAELAACDIRLSIFSTEPEFWPHQALNPLKDDALREKISLYWRGFLPKLER